MYKIAVFLKNMFAKRQRVLLVSGTLFCFILTACSAGKPYYRTVHEVFLSNDLQKDDAHFNKLFNSASQGNRYARAAAIYFLSSENRNIIDEGLLNAFILERLLAEKDFNVQILLLSFFSKKVPNDEQLSAILSMFSNSTNEEVRIAVIKYATEVLLGYKQNKLPYSNAKDLAKELASICSAEELQQITNSSAFPYGLECYQASFEAFGSDVEPFNSTNSTITKVLELRQSGNLNFVLQ